MDKQTTFELAAEEGSPWRLRIYRHRRLVYFDLHWKDKFEPTHRFTATVVEFKKMVDSLISTTKKPS